MSEEDSTAFNVVDRRTGTKSAGDETQPQAPIEEPGSELNDYSVVDSKVESTYETDRSDEDSADFDDRTLPDPAFLLNMATVQMDAPSLLRALIPVFDGFAWRSMGFVADPRTGETKKDMPGAQLAIDAVQFLLSKVEAQLSDTDRRDIHRRLSDLRMNYIAKLREP